MSEEADQKKEKEERPKNVESNPYMFEDGDGLVIKPESNLDVEIPKAEHSYTDYKASEETWQMAFQEKKREYLKGIAKYDKFTVFLDSTSEEVYKKNPYADPKYDKQVTLIFNADISNRQYEYFQKLRAEVQDMERTSFGSLVDYKEMGVRPPENFASLRQNRQKKESNLYNVGLQIFFKMKKSPTATSDRVPDGMINLMEMRSTRDLIDAMDVRLNLGIRGSVSSSTNTSSTKRNMSTSIT